jgi:hypothetical protein
VKLKSKRVLLGHQEDRNVIFTNEDFYIKRPLELRKKLMLGDGKEMDPLQLKIKLSVQIPSPKQTKGEMVVNIELREIKVFLRLNVFNELSKFTITGLDRLNRQANPELPDQPQEVVAVKEQKSGKMRIKILMADSIICLERNERTRKVLVLKMNGKIEMASISEGFLKEQMTK